MGAILAAGRGTRMWPFSQAWPKPLLPICNQPIITYQIEMMRDVGITDIVILIGHKGYEITKVLGDGSALDVRLRYVEQTEMLGIAHAVGHLEEALNRPFLLFLGDIFLKVRKLETLISTFAERQADAVLATKEEPDPAVLRRNFAVIRQPDGLVTRVIEKPRHPPSSIKGVGLYAFAPTIFDAIRRTPRTAMRDEYELTEAIQVLIEDGHRVYTADVVEADLNLTNPYDLLAVNLGEARARGASVVHPSAVLGAPERVKNSVIGAHARVAATVELDECLLFDHAEVTGRGPMRRCIVTQDGMLDCSGGPDGELFNV